MTAALNVDSAEVGPVTLAVLTIECVPTPEALAEAKALLDRVGALFAGAEHVRALARALPTDPEADAATDRFLAAQYAREGKRALARRGAAR